MAPTVTRVIPAARTPEGDGMVVQRAFPNQSIARIDPFLMLDEMGPITFEPGARSGFPDHPHRGFETVTMLLDGEFEHKDSHGNRGRLRPGDVQWMTAGAGVVHSEMPSSDLRAKGGRLHGFQLWVNLPQADKMMRPRYQEMPASSIPEAKVHGAVVRVVAGDFQGTKAAIDTRTPIQYFHAQLEDDAAVQFPVPEGHEGFVYVFHGSASVAGKAVPAHNLAVLSGSGEVTVHAGGEGAHLLFVTGVPLREPIFQYGPFVMTTREEIVQAVEDFRSGKFGEIAPTSFA
ncbi:MAG TPA: pirin family protein [Candidatus Thermoplasmatota archaeon]|nr:pirin family protein [Candidatus Thermoplasmatota archaeon]